MFTLHAERYVFILTEMSGLKKKISFISWKSEHKNDTASASGINGWLQS